MIRLTIGTNTKKETVLVEPNTTLDAAIEQSGVQIGNAALTLNGTQIPGVDKELTLAELGIKDESTAMLIAVIKADSAI